MTYLEKNSKYLVLVGLLVYLIYNNLSFLDLNENPASARGQKPVDTSMLTTVTSLFDWRVFQDMQKELTMLAISVGGYIFMARMNNYLD